MKARKIISIILVLVTCLSLSVVSSASAKSTKPKVQMYIRSNDANHHYFTSSELTQFNGYRFRFYIGVNNKYFDISDYVRTCYSNNDYLKSKFNSKEHLLYLTVNKVPKSYSSKYNLRYTLASRNKRCLDINDVRQFIRRKNLSNSEQDAMFDYLVDFIFKDKYKSIHPHSLTILPNRMKVTNAYKRTKTTYVVRLEFSRPFDNNFFSAFTNKQIRVNGRELYVETTKKGSNITITGSKPLTITPVTRKLRYINNKFVIK